VRAKSKVKSQKAKVKSEGRLRFGVRERLGFSLPLTVRTEALLTFDFCLLTFDLPFT
jgi:hypothetical protein